MMKIFISDAVVSKGYDGAPAIRFFNSETAARFAVFQVGNRKYDSREENNHRWVNLKIKAFGEICERIKKMKLKEGSVVTIFGDYDEERWTDKESKEKRSSPVINLDDIQYSYSGSGQKKGQNGGAQDGTGPRHAAGLPNWAVPAVILSCNWTVSTAGGPSCFVWCHASRLYGLREFQWREQSLFPRLSMQLAEPIKYNYKRQRAHMKSEPSTPCALFFAF